jgi:hypothetical protein
MDEYQYKRLDHDRPTFRLLRLHQGIQDELTCNLFEALFHHDDLIQYEALSYTWGASATPKSVTVDEQKLAITENLHQALISLRRPYADRILWIDAICIDQGHTKERSHQVAQMSDIYKQADRVIFFLGRATSSTDAFMDCMNQVQQKRERYAYRSWARDDKFWRVIQETIQGNMNKHDIEMLPLGLIDLLNRPWFRRVWILQEVANAKDAIVCCGRKEIAASVFSIAPVIFDVNPSVHCQSVIDIMPGPWRKTSWWSKDPCLYTLLSKFGGAQATESQDLVYALRGIATDKESPILTPDYDKSDECLVRDIVRFLFDFEYDAKMAWSMLGTVRDAIRGLEQMKDCIFLERIKAGEASRLNSLLQAPGFTFSPAHVVPAAIQYDMTGQMTKMLMKHAKGYEVDMSTLRSAVEQGSVPMVQVLEHHLGNGAAVATMGMLLAAAANHRHGGDMVAYILGRNPDLGDCGVPTKVAEVAASNSTQAARIIQQLLGRGNRITMTHLLHKNAFENECYEEVFLLFLHYPLVGLQIRDEAADVDTNKSADAAAENARTVFKSIFRFLLDYENYDDTIFDIFRRSYRQIKGRGFLEELALCVAEVSKERDCSLPPYMLICIVKESRLDLWMTIGVVKASIKGRFTSGISLILARNGDSVDIDPDAAAEIICAYDLGEEDNSFMMNFILQYRHGQYRYTKAISEALEKRYCDPESRPHGGFLHTTSKHNCYETLRWLLSCGADPNKKDVDGNTLLTSTGDCRTVALLLSYSADPNMRRERKKWRSNLCLAVGEKNLDLLELLLVCGAHPNILDGPFGNTPLTRAAHVDDIRLVKLLLQYGADTAVRNDKGEGAEDLAKSDAIISLLRKHSSRSPVRMLRISPNVDRIMKDHGLVPKPHEGLLGTRLLRHNQEIGYKVHGLCENRKFKDISE